MSKMSTSADRLHRVIIGPVVSEKSNRVAELNNRAVFRVLRDADKHEIKTAVETLFSVEVTSVRTLNVKGKSKRFGRYDGRRPDWKKAYVTLAAGQQIDFIGQGAGVAP